MMSAGDSETDIQRDMSRLADEATLADDSLPHGGLPARETVHGENRFVSPTMTVEPFKGAAGDPVEADDAVHFDVAAKALKVSRRTVERMVKRGELEREMSPGPLGVAKVSKRSLVTALEARRRPSSDLAELTRDMSRQNEIPANEPHLGELIEALIDQVVEARSSSSALEAKVSALEERARPSARDDLLATLVAGTWSQRRRARKAAIAEAIRRSQREDASTPAGDELALPE